ncbi:MAG: ABC transporter ATP-binding protein, partial [Myxococcota bacterium]
MAGLRTRTLKKAYGDTVVLTGIELEVNDGEYVVLVGPSGCGKSTLLRCIAGLEVITEGDLFIGDRRVNDLAPRERDVAMVFQSYALYPHMTVRQNMGFALKIRGDQPKAIAEAVDRAATMLDLSALLDRYPSQLSGGQRQRVAMGRAIVRRPAVFLFDEPLSNLDPALRDHMRVELKRLHRQLDTTVVHVTHDQVEALTLA